MKTIVRIHDPQEPRVREDFDHVYEVEVRTDDGKLRLSIVSLPDEPGAVQIWRLANDYGGRDQIAVLPKAGNHVVLRGSER